jgi:hypothetical protein
MDIDPDTVLVTVYCVVDDFYRAECAEVKPVRRGRRPMVSDSEVLTLAILAQWQPDRSERAFLRYAHRHWRGYFPRLLSQSAFNRRVRDLSGVLCRMGSWVSQRLATEIGVPAFEVIDGVGVPVARRCRSWRHRVFADAVGIGRGGSDRSWYYGVKLQAAVDAHGSVTGFVTVPANTEERWATDALLRWRCAPAAPAPTASELAPILGPAHRHRGDRIGPTGPIGCRLAAGQAAAGPYITDLGMRGDAWRQHWQADYGAVTLLKSDFHGPDAPAAARWLCGLRQLIETVFAHLTATFGLSFPRARSSWGLNTRLAAKIAALNLTLLINHLYRRLTFTMTSPFA